MMKAILSVVLVLGACGLMRAAEDPSDPVGTWTCTYALGGQQRTATLKLQKDGDQLVGTMSWPDQKATKLQDVKQTDGKVTFAVVRKYMNNDINCTYELTFQGDTFQGGGSSSFGGGKSEWHIQGKREKEEK